MLATLTNKLSLNDIVSVTIVKTRLYKIHIVTIQNYDHYNAVLIATNFTKICFVNKTVTARVIRLNNYNVDLVPID
ncbi:hypothetical protein [Ectropis obliqua nucleopolyhedrovirus]|uniref:Uncharacterized protein n=1 Tax=Ectropis obliqua nucleopolyhedrovirus TaxID=59376 RepID=A0EYS5_9ABAC|nr:hypothetical protein EONV_gp022 [Ectropis obliqua nucleopolyhedrovirus]ABI35705.1 hypothetical protein [Ectropis obliqua nucleopolyhedrovirus]QWV59608.1 hypothetical protein EONV_gp022 [Ectropis obliqua nucleopolyhedrovirus]UYO72814.1 hypothetical protein EONV-gp022 [Ectropis obliqua nucleopolyhedrovirus]